MPAASEKTHVCVEMQDAVGAPAETMAATTAHHALVKRTDGERKSMPGQQHVRCVVLVIAHRSPSYAPFREVWDAHWRRATTNGSDRLRFYLYNDPAVGAPPDSLNEELTFPYEETYPAPGLLLKTLAAIDLLAAAGVTYDFLLRTNLSSLFDWPAFDAYLDAAPRPPALYAAGVEYRPRRLSGACVLLSHALVADLAANRTKLDLSAPDDEAIALYLLQHHPHLTYPPMRSRTIAHQTPRALWWDVVWTACWRNVVHYRFHHGQGLSDDRDADQRCMWAVHEALRSRIPLAVEAVLVVLLLVLFCTVKRTAAT